MIGPIAGLTESPVWDVEEQRLYWVDIAEGALFRCTADGRELSVWPIGGETTSISLRQRGGIITTIGSCIYRFDPATGERELVLDAEPRPGFGFNDGKADRQGRFITGIVEKALVARGTFELVDQIETLGRLCRFDPDGSFVELPFPNGITNGVSFSPDGETLYCGDSWKRRVHVFDYDTATGTPSNRRVFAQFEAQGASPDGSTVDAEGCLWVCGYEGSELRRYTPDGTLDRRIPMPVDRPTSVAFGGSELDILFVTSAGSMPIPGRAIVHHPLGGCVFAIHGLDVRGVPETRFAG
jgi:sugar lactone lactonase YvrE